MERERATRQANERHGKVGGRFEAMSHAAADTCVRRLLRLCRSITMRRRRGRQRAAVGPDEACMGTEQERREYGTTVGRRDERGNERDENEMGVRAIHWRATVVVRGWE
jgi:hypothetical protein